MIIAEFLPAAPHVQWQYALQMGVRLTRTAADLRADFGAGDTSFVVGNLGEFLKRERKAGTPNMWPVVNDPIALLSKRSTRAIAVESTGLKHKVHFDTHSPREFGKHHAQAMQGLQGKEP